MDNNNQVSYSYRVFEHGNSSYHNFICYDLLGTRNTEEGAQAIINNIEDTHERNVSREHFILAIENAYHVVIFNHDNDWSYQGHKLYNHEVQVEQDYIEVEDAPEEIQEEVPDGVTHILKSDMKSYGVLVSLFDSGSSADSDG